MTKHARAGYKVNGFVRHEPDGPGSLPCSHADSDRRQALSPWSRRIDVLNETFRAPLGQVSTPQEEGRVMHHSSLVAGAVAVTCFALTTCSLAMLYWFDQHPYLVWPDPVATPGTLPRGGDGEVLVVVEADAIRNAAARGDFRAWDAGAAWWNWVTQSVGPGSMMDVDEVGIAITESVRLLILTRSASNTSNDRVTGVVRAVLEAGGGVILEGPGPSWRLLSGVALGPDQVPGGRFTRAVGLHSSWFASLPSGLNLPIRRQPVLEVDGDVEPILWIDGEAVAFRRRVGPGVVFSLALDMGYLWQTVQQGRPDRDLKVRNRFPEVHADPVETNDLVADAALLTAEVPVADLLEDWFFRVVADDLGIPGWWAYPAAARGAFVMTHDEEGMGERAVWMAEAEHGWGCVSTNFLVPSPAVTEGMLRRYQSLGAEVGLHLVRPDRHGRDHPGSGIGTEGRYRLIGLWRIHPVRILLNPGEQWAWLRARGNGAPVAPVSRTHFLRWSDTYAGLFESLEQAGIRLDSSYGPDVHDRGYLFGTARPFHPLGVHGLPLSILELPFVSAEDLGGADHTFLTRLLQDSVTSTHQALVVLFHPNVFRWHPSVENYLTWKNICQEAADLGAWVTTLSSVERFMRTREQATLMARPAPEGLRITYGFNAPGGTLVLPADLRGRRLREVATPEGERVGIRWLEMFGIPVALVQVPDVRGTLLCRYGSSRGDGLQWKARGSPDPVSR